MIGLLVLLFLVVPIAELYVILQVSHGLGIPQTILLLIAISVVGAWLAKAAGISVLNRLQRTVRQGKVPSAELVDGGLVLFAGALMITPGFLSDCLAILLLLAPTRAIVRRAVLRRIKAGGGVISVLAGVPRAARAGRRDDAVWGVESRDVESWDDPPGPTAGPGLGR